MLIQQRSKTVDLLSICFTFDLLSVFQVLVNPHNYDFKETKWRIES